MVWSNIHYLPVFSFVLLPGTFLTTYVISLLKNDVTIFFPYISDTGNRVPESCIFSQFVNLSAFLFIITIYIRYKQVEQYYRDHLSSESSKILRINTISMKVGMISCLGLSVVANFQEINLRVVHLLGANVCFVFGLVYCSLQTWMSFKMHPLVNSQSIARIRLFLTLLMLISFLTSAVLGPYALTLFHGPDRTRWKYEDGGYYYHMAAAIAEWSTALCLNFFLLSYAREMHKISVSEPKIIITIDYVNLINGNQNDNENSFYQNGNQVDIVNA